MAIIRTLILNHKMFFRRLTEVTADVFQHWQKLDIFLDIFLHSGLQILRKDIGDN